MGEINDLGQLIQCRMLLLCISSAATLVMYNIIVWTLDDTALARD